MSNANCVNPSCFSYKMPDSALCRYCRDLRDSVLVVGICGGLCVLIICAAKLGRLI